jgi:dephospho-CoA kinase
MITVAVTGGAGSGKSTVCNLFEELGAHNINLDQLARRVVVPGSDALRTIVGHLGADVLASDGTLDRRKVRQMMVRDPATRKLLERCIHPEIFKLLRKKLNALKQHDRDAVVAIEVPLLFEADSRDQFDVVVLVEADREVQKDRIMARDRTTAEDTEALLGLQIPSKKKRAWADFVVRNVGTIAEIRPRVAKIYRQILKGL